jgi:hypothetical protein
MNAIIVGAVGTCVAVAALGSAYWYGRTAGADEVRRQVATDATLIAQARDASIQATADALSKLKVRHQTIVTKVQGEVTHEEHVVYRSDDCRLPDSGLRLANEALAGPAAQPAAAGSVPGADTSR